MKTRQKSIRRYTLRDFVDLKPETGLRVKGFSLPCTFSRIVGRLLSVFDDNDDRHLIKPRLVKRIIIEAESGDEYDDDETGQVEEAEEYYDDHEDESFTEHPRARSARQRAPEKKQNGKAIRKLGRGWWPTHRRWYQIMDYGEVALWAYLHHKYERFQGQLYDDKWLWCTIAMVQEDLGMTRHTQARIIKSLKEKKYIRTKRFPVRGGRPLRHFQLFTKRVQGALRKNN